MNRERDDLSSAAFRDRKGHVTYDLSNMRMSMHWHAVKDAGTDSVGSERVYKRIAVNRRGDADRIWCQT